MIHLLNLILLVSEFIIDAYLAQRLLFKHHDGFREVNLTKIREAVSREEKWYLMILRLICL